MRAPRPTAQLLPITGYSSTLASASITQLFPMATGCPSSADGSRNGLTAHEIRQLQARPLWSVDGFLLGRGELSATGLALAPDGHPERVSAEADALEASYDGLREFFTQQFQSFTAGTGALSG